MNIFLSFPFLSFPFQILKNSEYVLMHLYKSELNDAPIFLVSALEMSRLRLRLPSFASDDVFHVGMLL
jgi:hypothetical protein